MTVIKTTNHLVGHKALSHKNRTSGSSWTSSRPSPRRNKGRIGLVPCTGSYEGGGVAQSTEMDDEMSSLDREEIFSSFSNQSNDTYPAIQIQEGTSNKGVVPEEEPFLPVHESIWKKSFNALRDEGVHSALEHVAKSEGEAPWAKTFAGYLLSLYQMVWAGPGNLYPHLQLPLTEMMDIFSKVPSWSTAVIRVLSWHPSSPHLAVGLKDQVEIYHFLPHQGVTRTILRDKQQQNITDVQWAPHYHSILAVAAEDSLVVWCLDLEAVSQNRLTPTSSRVESCPAHSPIMSLSWCPYRLSLITCSPCDTRMKLWDIPLGLHTDVERYKGGGVTMVKWSPDGSRVFAATPSPMFRVWETSMWTCEQWTNLANPCSAAVWDPKGETLLFALRDEPAIFCITFPKSGRVVPSNAVRCVDLTSPSTLPNGAEVNLRGTVKDLIWSHCGSKLAVIFDDCSVVALFHVKLWPSPDLYLSEVVEGARGSQPLVMDFQRFTSSATIISIGWSTGVITTKAI